MSLTYSNPRTSATFTDWPYGRDLRCSATFTVEAKAGKGERVSRVTIDPRNGRAGAPKTTTYAKAVRIVDGSDGKTYIVALSVYGLISVMQSNLQLQQESIGDDDGRYPALRAMLAAEGQS